MPSSTINLFFNEMNCSLIILIWLLHKQKHVVPLDFWPDFHPTKASIGHYYNKMQMEWEGSKMALCQAADRSVIGSCGLFLSAVCVTNWGVRKGSSSVQELMRHLRIAGGLSQGSHSHTFFLHKVCLNCSKTRSKVVVLSYFYDLGAQL